MCYILYTVKVYTITCEKKEHIMCTTFEKKQIEHGDSLKMFPQCDKRAVYMYSVNPPPSVEKEIAYF